MSLEAEIKELTAAVRELSALMKSGAPKAEAPKAEAPKAPAAKVAVPKAETLADLNAAPKVEEPKIDPTGPVGVTREGVKKVFVSLLQKQGGQEKVKKILAQFKVDVLSKLPEEHLAAAMCAAIAEANT